MARDRRATYAKGATMSETHPPQQHRLDRAGVFAALARLDTDRAVVEFSGGNDEGGPDTITLFNGEETVRTLPTWWQAGDADEDLIALADAVSDPVFEAYGTFAGDFDVTGEVIWDAQTKTVQMIRDERSEYEHSEDYI
jgi:hypothetical protein